MVKMLQVSERKLAKELGYPSPIHDNLEATHAAYNRALGIMLDDIAQPGSTTEVMVATHNQHSVEYTIARMRENGIAPDRGVHFAQLLGMADNLTYVRVVVLRFAEE